MLLKYATASSRGNTRRTTGSSSLAKFGHLLLNGRPDRLA